MINAAILGGGFMGATHGAGFQALAGRARVKTVASRDSERSRKLAADLGATFTIDIDDVMADGEIDLVDVCLPTELHREVTETALARGKHVLLEKPIALTLEDADAIVEAAASSKGELMVGLVLRFFAEYVAIQELVESGEIGAPLAASAYRLSQPADWNDWMADPARSGGTPVDLMVHDFDQLNALFGPPSRVFARAAGDAGAGAAHVIAEVEYERGVASVEGSMAMPASYPFSAGIRLVCERGTVEHGFRAAPAEDGGNIGGDLQSFVRVHPADGPARDVEVEGGDPWGAEIAYLVERIEAGQPVERATAEQARAGLRVSLATNRSLESGQPEEV
jgi:predicted dehydrogenase